jgi:diguanylate cyclase (GGDEF)-like protein
LAGNVATYFEPGTAIKVGLRTGVPVRDTDGALIGVVSAGVMFDTDKAVDELKRLFDSEVTVISGDTRVATTIMQDGQRAVGTQIDPDIAKTVIGGGREYANGVDIFGKRYKAFYQPFMNAQNEAFAAIILAIPVADLEAASNRSIRDGILLGLCGLAVSIVLLFYIISSISDPIVKLSRDVRHIADGNLDIDINADGDDEVGHLGRSVRVVAATLSKLLSDIDIMIAEREKGHTDYHLNAEEFLGAYKALADNILDLTDIGMKDQLTGIPNRRSFDNRLDMEWGRAMREKKPISVLIADVDKFKTYNDAYGHPQGDVALKTVAEVLNGAVRRSIDIAARWGGEEFVALLPGTDSDGAMAVAEKIRAAIENASIPCADPKAAKVTASVGVNTRIPAPGVLVRDFISAADDALYQAKEAGRNRVVLARVAPEA